ncbi:MAG: tol-pal system protein YbgF [Desulfovibrio sp.]|nr:tol-pal system protein YbgF [Desulfovibrio sp.]
MRAKILFLIGAGCLGFTVSCAPFDSSSSLERRVDQQDLQLREMQPRQADTWNEVQAMRQEINELKGQLAELNRGGATAQASGSPETAAADAAPGGAAIATTSTQRQGYEPVTGIQLSPNSAPDSSAYQQQGTAVQTQASYGLPSDTPPMSPSEETWGKADPTPEPQAPAPQKDLALALFDSGVNAYKARDYTAATKSFRDFLKNYPKNAQAAQAQFYLGECNFQRNKFADAALDYNEVLTKYPKSSSAPEAMLKQGVAFSKMGQPAAAKKRMQEVISKYPNSQQATRAKNFLKTNK